MMTANEFGTLIRQTREAKQMSLRELSRRVDRSAPALSDIEHGRRFPGPELLAALARVLELDPDRLKLMRPGVPSLEVRVAQLERQVAELMSRTGGLVVYR